MQCLSWALQAHMEMLIACEALLNNIAARDL